MTRLVFLPTRMEHLLIVRVLPDSRVDTVMKQSTTARQTLATKENALILKWVSNASVKKG